MMDASFVYHSQVLNRQVAIRCLVPQGRDLKCLFLLHGYGGNHNQWCEKSIISRLAQQYRLVVVMPGCGDGYYEDTREDLPRFIGEELVTYVQQHLPVSPKREDRFIGGVSMGGFGALLIGAGYGDVFGKIVSFSGAFIIGDVVIGNQGVLGNANPQYFKDVFGDLEQLEGSHRDPVAQAIRAAGEGKMPPVFLLCGDQDVLHRCNRKTAGILAQRGISTVWYSGAGGHRWPFWNEVLPAAIQWLTEGTLPEGAERVNKTE
jgi:S-formylglutathione hydrolase FrmB